MAIDCAHHENITWEDRHQIGTCIHCGQVKQYPRGEKGTVVILKEGDPAKANPKDASLLTQEVETPVTKAGREVHMRKDLWERHKYYEEHKQEIKESLLTVGRHAAEAAWGITSPTMQGLIHRWLTQEEKEKVREIRREINRLSMKEPEIVKPGESVAEVSTTGAGDPKLPGYLPRFPEFNEQWTSSTKEEWLRQYVRLMMLAGATGSEE